MSLNWIKASKQLPDHNQTILLEDDWGGISFAVFKKYNDKIFGLLDLFILLDRFESGDDEVIKRDEITDFYRDNNNLQTCDVDVWIPYDDIKYNPKRCDSLNSTR